MGATLNGFFNKVDEFQTLPVGESFSITITDREASKAAQEYLAENRPQVKQLLQAKTGMKLDVENPNLEFREDEVFASLSGGVGFLKAKVTMDAEVRWDDGLIVNVRSVSIPFLSATPQKLNSLVEGPINRFMKKVEQYAEIRSFKLTNGSAVLEAVRK